jgi:outer membrane protein
MSKRLISIVIIIMAAAGAAFAQGAAVQSTAQANKPATGGIAPMSSGKMAIIDSRAFAEGIGEMKKQLDKLETEFQPRTKDLQGLQDQLVKLDEELKVAGNNMKPDVYQQKVDQMAGMKKEFERKREDYQTDLQKRSELVLGPIQDKLHKFMENYAAQREIIMIFDLAPAAQAGLVFLNPGTNITEDFIKEYNKQNPVPGAPPQPEPQIK